MKSVKFTWMCETCRCVGTHEAGLDEPLRFALRAMVKAHHELAPGCNWPGSLVRVMGTIEQEAA